MPWCGRTAERTGSNRSFMASAQGMSLELKTFVDDWKSWKKRCLDWHWMVLEVLLQINWCRHWPKLETSFALEWLVDQTNKP